MTLSNKPNVSPGNLDQDSLLHRMIERIRRSLDLEEILTTTVNEVRDFLDTDRVKIYKFADDGSGEVIAESISQQRLPSLLGLHFPDQDIPLAAKEMFLSARQRSIVDVAAGKIGLSPLQSKETGETLFTDNIYYHNIDPCYINYLKIMGVQSSLTIPILYCDLKEESTKQKLWGLLVSHHSKPRTILKRELKLVQHVADQVAIAISQNQLLEATRAQREKEAIVNSVSTALHQIPKIEIQSALETTIKALNGVGGRLYIQATQEVHTWGAQLELPDNRVIEWLNSWQIGKILAIKDIYQGSFLQDLAIASQPTKIRGLMVIPLHYQTNFLGIISIYRPEYDTEILWAGRCDQEQQRHQLPSLSFHPWREERKGQALEWKPEEIALAQALSQNFSIAIQHQQTYLELQQLNSHLSSRVQEKTNELEQSLLLTQVLKQVTDQIRSTLDLQTILQTIVSEVRPLLNSDRVLVYQLRTDTTDTGGEVTVEEVSGNNWRSVLGMKLPSECFPPESNNIYQEGKARAINDVLSETISPCHRDFLQSIQVQANLIVPIKIGHQLWGLLIAHQCEAPRIWQDIEIDLLQQLADKAAIAIQQAQLYEQSCAAEAEAINKAKQLERTLHQLQQTQTQLIHTEKMSSLGQLVAGIAHEINNPVNFIYGNLNHASEYIDQILQLLQLYQLHYPHPPKIISSMIEAMDMDFLVEDLPKTMSSMSVGADRIRSIVLSLRNFSRLDESADKSVDLHEGIDNTLLIIQHRLKPFGNCPGIEIVKDYGDLPKVICYAGHMNQVFMNIINNAIDALGESFATMTEERMTKYVPKITITTRASIDNSHLLIKISDNGAGMSEEVKKRIFDPFFTTKPVGKGTGMGMAISYKIIVEEHGGMMGCLSELGRGTEFWIEIPLKEE